MKGTKAVQNKKKPKGNIAQFLRMYVQNKNYVSVHQVKSYLQESGVKNSEATVKQYLSNMKRDGLLYDSGRGYYSTLKEQMPLEYESLVPLRNTIREKYSSVQFSLWSTEQLKYAFHHLQSGFVTFVYAEKDALEYVRDYLVGKNYKAVLNPSRTEAMKYNFAQPKSIILRPLILRGSAIEHFAAIENIFVDLMIEKDELNLLDEKEYERVFSYIVTNFRIRLGDLLRYAERLKVVTRMKSLLIKYTNAAF
ncbi:MAG: hypothetical protein HYZ34_10975 [Ignavibacteriae bacterium]|nr:hypothetical protein [Ignavibacteriota bacterium]